MEKDFRYFKDEHGDAGAREIFEKICTELLCAEFGSNAHNIRVSQGDEGMFSCRISTAYWRGKFKIRRQLFNFESRRCC